MTRRILFWVQHLLGIGHVERSYRIAEALAGTGFAVTLASGGRPVAALAAPAGVRVVQLPPVTAHDAGFALFDAAGRPLGDAVRTARRDALLALLAETRPDALMLEGFPFARRAFRFELDPLIAAARVPVLCSVRDIVVDRGDPARRAEIVARVRTEFAAVLVHGDPRLVPFEASFPAAPELAGRLVYTGYVAAPAPPESAVPRGEVLVSAGGGRAGAALMQAAIAARRQGCLAAAPWRLLAGADLPEAEFAALAAAAPDGVAVERFRRDFTQLLRQCRVSVSQLGYNTALDLIAARVPAVVVPFAAARETEQAIRAACLAARGAVEVVPEAALSPQALAAAIARVDGRRPPPLAVDTGGAARTARIVARLLAGEQWRSEGLGIDRNTI